MTEETAALVAEKIERHKQTLRDTISFAREKNQAYPEGREAVAVKLGDIFKGLKDSPCPTCTNHCCKSSEAVGYFHATFPPEVLSGEINLEDFFVAPEEKDIRVDKYTYSGEFTTVVNIRKCHFLDPKKGCNIPIKYRSDVCLSFSCHVLSDVLKKENLLEEKESLSNQLYSIRWASKR